MRLFHTAGFIWTGILLSLAAYGQGNPLGTIPMQHIGSFAGEAGAPRFSGIMGNGVVDFTFSTGEAVRKEVISVVSYDQFIPALRSGIGITAGYAEREWAAPYDRAYYKDRYLVSLDVAPKLSIRGKYTLSPSVSLQYTELFAEGDTQPLPDNKRLSSRIGLLWNTPRYYIGYSVDNIYLHQYSGERPSYGLRSTLQTGYTFKFGKEAKFSFTPQVAVHLFGGGRDYYNFWLGGGRILAGYNLNFKYKKVIWGLNNGGFHLGYQNEKLRLMLTNSFLVFSGPYTANLSCRYVFK